MDRSFLPYGRQMLDEDDIAAVVEVLRGEMLTTGPKVQAFEEAVAAKVGAKYAVSCSSGTAALHLTALALKLGEGDAVIIPTLTFLATANSVRFAGAEVIFADVDQDTGLMGVVQFKEAINRATNFNLKAVFLVHLNGQCVDMQEIRLLAKERGITVVEDACHAIGTAYSNKSGQPSKVGSCQDSSLTIFSFHPVKTVTMGEGGLVTTNDPTLYHSLLRLRNHGMERDPAKFLNRELAFDHQGLVNPWYYEMSELGYNYRVSDISCALGLSQIGKLDQFVRKRAELVAWYDQGVSSLAPLAKPLGRVVGCHPSWHLYVLLIDFSAVGMTRASLIRALKKQGIGTQVQYLPLHKQPYYSQRYGQQKLPGSELYYQRALSLPLFPAMTEDDVNRVVDSLAALLNGQT